MCREEKITCDHCGRDLTTTTNAIDYRIILAADMIPSAGRTATLVHYENPLPQSRYFCSLSCLKEWSLEKI